MNLQYTWLLVINYFLLTEKGITQNYIPTKLHHTMALSFVEWTGYIDFFSSKIIILSKTRFPLA